MSRQGNVAEHLVKLQQLGVIKGWVKDSDPANPNRVSWHVMLDEFESKRYTTSEVEAFIEGYKRAL